MAQTEEKKTKKANLYGKVCLVLTALIVIINAVAWVWPAFCDWHVRKILPLSLKTIGRFSNQFSMPLGDIFLVVTVLLLLTGVCLALAAIFFRGRIWRITKRYWRIMFVYILVVVLELTVNWWVLYHTTSLRDKEVPADRQFTNVEYAQVMNAIVRELNTLSGYVTRDEKGIPVADMEVNPEAIAQMAGLSAKYPLLAGYYPNAKEMTFSDFFSQQYIAGYYFPVTMESNINARMADVNDPQVVCHELAHLKGYIREDEAEYLGILACLKSNYAYFRYSGLLAAFDRMRNNLPPMPDSVTLEPLLPIVYDDDVFLTQENWDEVEENAIISTDVVSQVSNTLVDTSLKLNGVEEGIGSYDEVTTLLLHHFLDQ